MTEVTNIEQLQRTESQRSQSAPKLDAKNKVMHLIESNKAKLVQAMPAHLNKDRLLRVMITAIAANPKLLGCTVPSLLGSLMQLSTLGLEPNTVLGHAYLIPFRNNKRNVTEVQLIIGYKGLIDLARRSGNIVSIAAHEVCERDMFEFEYGLDEKLRHIPAGGDRGKVTHFYAVAKLEGGGYAFEVMTAADVEKIRDGSQGRNNDVWKTNFVEMGRKTLIRRISKYLPLTIELASAVALDEITAHGGDQALEGAINGEWAPVPEEEEELAAQQAQAPALEQSKPDHAPTQVVAASKEKAPTAAHELD